MNTVNREFACDDAKVDDVSDSYRLDGCGVDLTHRQADKPILVDAKKPNNVCGFDLKPRKAMEDE